VRYSQIQLDAVRYVRIQWDTAYSGIQWICCKMTRYSRDTAGYQEDTVRYMYMRYRQDTGEIQTGDPTNTRQGRAACCVVCCDVAEYVCVYVT